MSLKSLVNSVKSSGSAEKISPESEERKGNKKRSSEEAESAALNKDEAKNETGKFQGKTFVTFIYSIATHKSRNSDFPDALPLDHINYNDTVSGNNKFKLKLQETLPAVIYSLPKELKERRKKNKKKYKNAADEKRAKEWSERLVSDSDLKNPTSDKTKITKPTGLKKYLFIKEVIASRTGLLYYLIPTLANIIFLFANIHFETFVQNLIVSLAALTFILLFRKLLTTKTHGVIFKVFMFLLLFAVTGVLTFCVYRFIPSFWNSIYLPFAIKLLLIIFCLYYFGKFYAIFAISYAQDLTADFGNTVQIKCGKPRVGKSSLGTQESLVLAQMKWDQLQYDFWLWHSREKEILKRNDNNELLEYHEIKTSYYFYINHPEGIPCLWSNIGIKDQSGRKSFEITLNHIRGLDRLPLYTVAFLDEIGAVLKAEISNSGKDNERPYDVSDMFRLGGHFLKWSVIACEQDFNNIYIDCRRVVGFNQLISSQQWVCRPGLLYSVFKTIKFFIQDSLDEKNNKNYLKAKFMFRFEKYVRSIGFRKYSTSYVENTETNAEIKKADNNQTYKVSGSGHIRYVPSCLIGKYSDRAYKKLYASYLDKSIIGKVHNDLVIGTSSGYGYQFVSKTNLINKKREAQREALDEARGNAAE